MNKPEKINVARHYNHPIPKIRQGDFDNGYNQACTEWEAYHEQEISKLEKKLNEFRQLKGYEDSVKLQKKYESLQQRLDGMPNEEEIRHLICLMGYPKPPTQCYFDSRICAKSHECQRIGKIIYNRIKAK